MGCGASSNAPMATEESPRALIATEEYPRALISKAEQGDAQSIALLVREYDESKTPNSNLGQNPFVKALIENGAVEALVCCARRCDKNSQILLDCLALLQGLAVFKESHTQFRAADAIVMLVDIAKDIDQLDVVHKKSLSTLNHLSRGELLRKELVAAGTVKVASAFMLTCRDDLIRFTATRIVIFLMATNEDKESQDLIHAGKCVPTLCKVLKVSLNGETVFGSTFLLEGLLQQIRLLAINDSIKDQLVNEGVLILLQQTLSERCEHAAEMSECVQALLLLSFNDRAAAWMRERLDASLGNSLKDLVDSQSQDTSAASDAARNLLFALSVESTTRRAADHDGAESRLSAQMSPESTDTPAVSIPKGKHVMVSYSWKQKEQVKRLVAALRQLGLVVWRDEEGTIHAPRIEGDTADAMARAVESSMAVIVCVSREYCESGNCRLEAKYAWGLKQRGELDMLFVMLQEDFTTVSKGGRVAGWLGFFIGQDLWYPLWSEGQIGESSRAISERIGKLSKGLSDGAPSESTTNQPNQLAPSGVTADLPFPATYSAIADAAAAVEARDGGGEGGGGGAAIAGWGVEEVCAFFERCGFGAGQRLDALRENGVNGRTLLSLTDDDITAGLAEGGLGLTRLQARRLRAELAAL